MADTNKSALYVVQEGTWGEAIASATMLELPHTGENIERNQTTEKSGLIRTDRQRAADLETAIGGGGPINIELSRNTYAQLFQGLLTNNLGATTTLSTVGATATGNKFTKTGIETNIVVGQWVLGSGFANAANNGLHRVTATAAGSITVASTLVTETAGAGLGISARMLRNGTLDKSYRLEKQFSDVSKFAYATGMRVAGLNLDIVAEQIITGVFTLEGKDIESRDTTIGGTRTSAGAVTPLTASANVGALTIGGVAITTGIRRISLNITNNTGRKAQIGGSAPVNIRQGFFDVEGTIEAYFEDHTLFNKAIARTPVNLEIPMLDASGHGLVLSFPNGRLSGGAPQSQGGNDDVIGTFGFTALLDTATSTTMQVDDMAKAT